jgi:hypothetical protein
MSQISTLGSSCATLEDGIKPVEILNEEQSLLMELQDHFVPLWMEMEDNETTNSALATLTYNNFGWNWIYNLQHH